MAISRQKKKEVYEKITKAVKENPSLVFVNFHKLPVRDAVAIRRNLRGEGVNYYVAKKTLIKKALKDLQVGGEMPLLEGEIAIAYGKDLVAPARGIYAFQKSLNKTVQIAGGIFEGQFKSKDEMITIASIPSRQALLGQFLNLINSPRQRFAVVLSERAKML